MRGPLRQALLACALLWLAGCASSPSDALIRVPVFEAPEDHEPASARPVNEGLPELEERDRSDNQLALLEEMRAEKLALEARLSQAQEKLASWEEKARNAADSEDGMARDLERLQRLLEDARRREVRHQRELIAARIEAVRLEQELVRARMRALGTESR